MAKIKTKLHSSQLYLPKIILSKLSLKPNSDVYLIYDADKKECRIQPVHGVSKKNATTKLLQMTKSPPKSVGNILEDYTEYDFGDI
ncbi:MAG: hypothetical protein ACTSRK_16310 [Promethearchaeota archaeon]